MLNDNSVPPRHLIAVFSCAIVLLGSLFVAAPRALAQTPDTYKADRERAIQLINENKFAEALPLFERLAAANQSDGQVMFGLGITVLFTSKEINDTEARRQARVRARTALLRAKELGISDENLEMLLKSITPDGGEPGVSKNKEANAAMDEAFGAFANENYKEAIEAYERAARLDPTLYEAALYAGNSHYAAKNWDKAGEWFARAIAIDADRETAYRYWGDALMVSGKREAAREKFFDAIIAEPYNQLAWRGLVQWAQLNEMTLGHPVIKQPPASMHARDEKGQTTILIDPKALDPKSGPNYYWSFYDLTRSTWGKANFAKEYPNEKVYRRSLKEEATALRIVAEIAAKDLKSGKAAALDSSLMNLIKLNDAELLEAYILLARANQEIARDYPEYRKSNRDKLRRYLADYVITSKQEGQKET